MEQNAGGKGCLGGFLAFLLFFIWSAALTLHFISSLVSPPSIKKFVALALQSGVSNKLELSDQAFYDKSLLAAQKSPGQDVQLIPQDTFRFASDAILKTKNARELYALMADDIIDPVYAPDAPIVDLAKKEFKFLGEFDGLKSIHGDWGKKNLHSYHNLISGITNILIVISVIIAALMALLMQGVRRMRASGIIAFIVALPWFIADRMFSPGTGWLKQMDMFSGEEGVLMLPALQAVVHDALWLSRTSFWLGLALIALSIIWQVQAKQAEPYQGDTLIK